MHRSLSGLSCLIVAALLALFPATAQTADKMPLTLGGRTVDLHPYFYAFPYDVIVARASYRRLFFKKSVPGGGSRLYSRDWRGPSANTPDLRRARLVTSVDLDRLNFWGWIYNPLLGGLVVQGDDDKRERINLWLYRDGSGKPTRLTDVDYIYRYTQSASFTSIFFTSRYGASDTGNGCLQHMKVTGPGTVRIEKLLCDTEKRIPATLNTWDGIRYDGSKIVFTAYGAGDRNKPELYSYDLKTKQTRRLVIAHDTSNLWVQTRWRAKQDFIYVRDRAVFYYDWARAKSTKLREYSLTIDDLTVLTSGKQTYFVVLTKGIRRSTLYLYRLDGAALTETDRIVTDLNPIIVDNERDTMLLYTDSARLFSRYEIVRVSSMGKFARKTMFPQLGRINARLSACKVELVDYLPSDRSAATKGRFRAKAYLFTPRKPPPAGRGLYIIEAFYGGYNSYSTLYHALCSVGVSVLSPTVRGDDRFGDAFERSNDREKADAPIRDVIASARYLMKRFALTDSRRIGTMGYSHGGWAALRAVSYPGKERFRFGFAIAGAGYFNFPEIVAQAGSGGSNILGWISKEFGDVKSQHALLRRLSPASHIDKIDAPIFLYHGENDKRIDVAHSKAFAAKLRAAGKRVTLTVVKGQGHSISGAANYYRIYKPLFEFLDGLQKQSK